MRVLIADDSALIRDGLAHVLPAARLRGRRRGRPISPALLAAVPATEPDVALIDIRMPPTFTDEGITAARPRSAIASPHVGVIVLSQHVDADYALTLLKDDPIAPLPAQGRPHPHRLPAQGPHHRHTHPRRRDRPRRRGETVVDPELVNLLLAAQRRGAGSTN